MDLLPKVKVTFSSTALLYAVIFLGKNGFYLTMFCHRLEYYYNPVSFKIIGSVTDDNRATLKKKKDNGPPTNKSLNALHKKM